MAQSQRSVRRSITLPPELALRIQALAKLHRTSANRVIVALIKSGLETKDQEKAAFFDLAERLVRTSDQRKQKRLKEELMRTTFGER